MKKIMIIAGQSKTQITQSTWELFAFAGKLAPDAQILFCMIGENTRQTAESLSARSGCRVISADVPGTAAYHPGLYKQALMEIASPETPDAVIAPHSTSGMDYAPALSVALDASCVTAVEDVETENSTRYFIRSVYGGKVQARIKAEQKPVVLTIQPGAFKAVEPDAASPSDVILKQLKINDSRMVYSGQMPSPSRGSGLTKAEVVVSGGRGIQEEDNFEFIEKLADIFPRSATGASRPICDYGWVNYSKQVGATGTIVSPRLYIACGISGSTQHLEGIRDSRFIVAINSDPDAPILKVADVCIIEELTEFIPVFIEAVKKTRRPAS